jgi:flavin reductase
MNPHPDPASFRAAAARFPTGVTVVASIDRDGTPVGMTANSFTTVSTKPPTVLVSVMRGRTWQAIMDSKRYAVNVLHAEDLALCAHFSGGPRAEGSPSLVKREEFPVLSQAIAQFACDVVRSIDVADHTLFIGEVRWCRQRDGSPLTFYSSRFCNGLGAAIMPAETIAYPADGWAI